MLALFFGEAHLGVFAESQRGVVDLVERVEVLDGCAVQIGVRVFDDIVCFGAEDIGISAAARQRFIAISGNECVACSVANDGQAVFVVKGDVSRGVELHGVDIGVLGVHHRCAPPVISSVFCPSRH